MNFSTLFFGYVVAIFLAICLVHQDTTKVSAEPDALAEPEGFADPDPFADPFASPEAKIKKSSSKKKKPSKIVGFLKNLTSKAMQKAGEAAVEGAQMAVREKVSSVFTSGGEEAPPPEPEAEGEGEGEAAAE